jgi:hypothetical protein
MRASPLSVHEDGAVVDPEAYRREVWDPHPIPLPFLARREPAFPSRFLSLTMHCHWKIL